ncbi:glycosyltransferase family 4 protein [Moorella sp. ACPs]|uniref:glycosyltransferase family 4 protein n=1 Tax=Neomoorella carbonis TaxID=3062783 RepID=UPI00387382EF
MLYLPRPDYRLLRKLHGLRLRHLLYPHPGLPAGQGKKHCHQPLEFHFCGRGHNDNAEKLMAQWAAGRERCFYYWKPLEMMPEIYRQADIVLIPSRSTEGTSLAALEAMACGKPVIAGLAGGLSDIIIHGYNGYLIKPTVENLVAAIEDLALNKDKRKLMGRRAREVAVTFDRKIWAERWARVLGEVFR